jgi:mRNA interferase MazF
VAYQFGDVFLASLVFPDAGGMKRRPVLVIHDPGDADLLVVPVTTHQPRSAEDVEIQNWAAAGLRLASTARMAKLATVSKSNVVHSLGRLTNDDASAVRAVLSRFFSAVLK